MVTRRTNRGTVLGPDEMLTVAEAVHCYTHAGAYSQFAENDRGALLPGMLANVAVLSQDIFAGAPEEILSTQADLTLRGGRVLFDRHGEAGSLAVA